MALYRDTARRAPAIGQPAMTTILIVEDEDAIRNNITRMLTLEGYEVVSAVNGRLGLELALQFIPTW